MAWVEQRGAGYRVRLRLPDGTVVTDSIHPDKPAAQLRAKEIDVEVGRDTFLDPRDGCISLSEWVSIWQEPIRPGRRHGRRTAATYACTSCPDSVTCH